jgi:hypothetical protein
MSRTLALVTRRHVPARLDHVRQDLEPKALSTAPPPAAVREYARYARTHPCRGPVGIKRRTLVSIEALLVRIASTRVHASGWLLNATSTRVMSARCTQRHKRG